MITYQKPVQIHNINNINVATFPETSKGSTLLINNEIQENLKKHKLNSLPEFDYKGELKHVEKNQQHIISFKAPVFDIHNNYYGVRSLTHTKQSGYQLEGFVSISNKKYPAFTSSKILEYPENKLVNIACIIVCFPHHIETQILCEILQPKTSLYWGYISSKDFTILEKTGETELLGIFNSHSVILDNALNTKNAIVDKRNGTYNINLAHPVFAHPRIYRY